MGRVGELLVILAIVFLLFGSRRLKDFGSDLGAAIKGFKANIGDDKQLSHQPAPAVQETLHTNVLHTENQKV